MKKIVLTLTIFVWAFTFTGCERNPAGALMYNGVNDSDPGRWSDTFVLYRNGDISTRVIPFDDAIGAYTNIWEKYANSKNVLEAQYKGESHSGYMSIKMGWDGQKSETFANPPVIADNASFWLKTKRDGTPLDLSMAGYAKISFWCKAELGSGTEAVINVFGHSYPARDIVISVSTGWAYYEKNITGADGYTPSSVDTYISVTMQPAASGGICAGGTIYLDDIRLSK
jgi:hypothetical protein